MINLTRGYCQIVFSINETGKHVYNKFDENGGVIICLYVDDLLIFRTNRVMLRKPTYLFLLTLR